MGQPREQAVPCRVCRRSTWNANARCDDHQAAAIAARRRPLVQPAMCCPRCGGMELKRSARSNGVLGSDARVPGQLCSSCGAWWPIAVGRTA
jgi:hypothetical protein